MNQNQYKEVIKLLVPYLSQTSSKQLKDILMSMIKIHMKSSGKIIKGDL